MRKLRKKEEERAKVQGLQVKDFFLSADSDMTQKKDLALGS